MESAERIRAQWSHSIVGEVAQYTWHQEPEQRPAGGSLGVGNGALAPDGVKQRGRSFP